MDYDCIKSASTLMSRKHGAGTFNNWRQPMSAKDVFLNICLVLKGSFSFIFDQTVLDYLRTRSFSHLSGRKNLEGKSSSTSYKVLSSILDGLWQHQLPNFEMEQAFNIVSSQLEPRCSVCSFFSKLEVRKVKECVLSLVRLLFRLWREKNEQLQ